MPYKYDWQETTTAVYHADFGPFPVRLIAWLDDEAPGRFFSSVDIIGAGLALYATKGESVPLAEAQRLAEKALEKFCSSVANLFQSFEANG